MTEEVSSAATDVPDPVVAAPRAGKRPRAARPPRPRGPVAPRSTPTVGFLVASGFTIVTLLVLLFGAYLFVGSRMAANREQDVMYDQMQTDLALAMVPVGGPIATGTPVGIMTIPALDLEQVFVIGSSSSETLVAPGLRHDSQLPGQAGVSVLVGRRASAGAPFADLDELRPGDTIDVTTGQGQFTYVVDLVRTSDAAASGIKPVDSRLTLITSDPAITSSRTLQVSAALKGKAIPVSTGVDPLPEDQAGAGSHGRAVALLLWAQLLLVVSVAVSWAAFRLPRRFLWGVWIGALPVLLAVLWNVFENLTVLLPNTL